MRVEWIEDLSLVDPSSRPVLMEENPRYLGQLTFAGWEASDLADYCPDFLSSFGVLKDLSLYSRFLERLVEDGFTVYAHPSAKDVLAWHENWSQPLEVENVKLINRSTGKKSSLFPYQQFGLRKAMDSDGERNFFYFDLGTGTGKGLIGYVGAQEMFNRDKIDVCLFFTLRQVKRDIVERANNDTNLVAKNIDGPKPKRLADYRNRDIDIYVLNYEKARPSIDLPGLLELVTGRRILIVADEVQKVLNHNQAREGLDKIIEASSQSWVWPMSASVINGNPERFHKAFDWAPINPLGTLKSFREEYVKETFHKKIRTRRGTFHTTERVWDEEKLKEVPHRIGLFSQSVRKVDPGVRELFKGLTFTPVSVEPSAALLKLYNNITALYDEFPEEQLSIAMAQRFTCLHPQSHRYANNPISQMIAEEMGPALDKIENTKMERMIEDISVTLDEGDKCVVFTHWTNISLNLIQNRFRKEKFPFVSHFGGQSYAENEDAKIQFTKDPNTRIFLSSDAGSHGLNLPQARIVFNYECPLSYDVLMQRNDRIDRADSWLDGLESRVYITEQTIEEKIWARNNARRIMSSNMQGTVETLSSRTYLDSLIEGRNLLEEMERMES